MSDDVTVSELATELNIPPSVLLEECHRAGIEASWAGAHLPPVAVALLRDRLGAAAEPPLRRPAPPPRSTPTPKLPPTAVGSLPDAAGGASPAAEPQGPGPLHRNHEVAGDATEVNERTLAEPSRRFDPTARTGIVAAGLGLLLAVVAPWSPHVLATVGAWLLIGIAGLVALISGNRSRYKISTHPEKLRGMIPAILALVVGLALLVGLGTGIWVVTRDAPASAAPDVVGARADVAELRWNVHRLARIKDGGWHRPAKDAGTCWALPKEDEEPRDDRRVETSARDRSCKGSHDVEVLAVFAVDRDADSAYPGADDLIAIGLERCAPVVDALAERPRDLRIEIEYPTEDGWADADHDVACVAVVTRSGSLTD